jgi:hypothetical protein
MSTYRYKNPGTGPEDLGRGQKGEERHKDESF